MFKKDDVPYELKDTWGENGDWTNNKQAVKKEEAPKEQPVKEEPKVEEKKEEVKEEAPPEEVAKEEVPQEVKTEEVAAKEEVPMSTEEKTTFKDDKLSVALDVSSWQEKESISKIKLFSKNIESSEVVLSLSGLKGLNDKLLDKSFKDKYINSLQSKLKDFQLVSSTDENLSNKKVWSITYSSMKNDTKLQQKQLFIPNKDNTIIVNIVSNEETLFKAETDITNTLSSLKVY